MIRLGAMGDVVRTFPAVCALRASQPQARISWLVEAGSAGAVELCPAVDEVLIFPREEISQSFRRGRLGAFAGSLLRLRRQLRAQDFDCVLDFHGLFKSGFLSGLSGSEFRVGYESPQAREFSWLFSHHRVPLPRPYCSRFERNRGLVEGLGLWVDPPGPIMKVPDRALSRMRSALGSVQRPTLLHPGTSEAAAHKRWAPERFAALAIRSRETTGRACLVLSGPLAPERALQKEIVEASEGAAVTGPTTGSLADLAALLSLGGVFVGADTGPLHMASLLGTPVLQLLGPTDPVHNEPYSGTLWRRAYVPPGSGPHRRRSDSMDCMDPLSVDLVWQELQILWKDVNEQSGSQSVGEALS